MNMYFYIKTSFSLLDSLITIDKLIDKAKKNNIDSLGICDTNVLYGVMEFYNKCRNNNIKPLIGMELEIEDYSILLYAKNYDGYKNLMKLSTIKSTDSITLDILKEYSSNLILVIPYLYKEKLSLLNTIFNDYYIAFKNRDEKKDIPLKDNPIYMNKILYLDKEDGTYYPYLNLIKNNLKEDALIYDDNTKFLCIEKKEFLEDSDIRILTDFKDKCNVEIIKHNNLIPRFKVSDSNSEEYFIKLCQAGLYKRLDGKVTKKYNDRLLDEIKVITNMGYVDYFLVVHDYIKFSRNNNILYGPGRGSAPGSLVSYCLGITNIDPIKYDLLFERFLNKERTSMPDIDIDFQDNRRDEVKKYCMEKYGNKKVAGIITFATLGARQVIRDVSRILDLPIKIADRLCSYIPYINHESISKIYNTNKFFKELIDSNKEYQKMYDIALHLEGLQRQKSIHAAGIVMADIDLDEVIPLAKIDEYYVTGFTMEHLEDLGLLKMDFLGLSNLTIIDNVLKEIKNKENIDIKLESIPFDDKKTIEIFTTANTEGIFQFESTGMKNFLRQLESDSFDDVIAAIALFRPGPANNIPHYINRKKGVEKIDYIDKKLEGILKSTYGIMIYQEQIIQIASVVAGYSLGEADILRRAMSKKKMDIMKNEEDKFITRSIENGFDKEKAIHIFSFIKKFAEYGFNKSHSVSYAVIAYRMAYLKAHYPKYFIAALLTNVIGSESKTKEYIYEARLNGINILKPDINKSDKYYVVEELGIRYPLTNIKNVGTVGAALIIKERMKSPFSDYFDFIKRCYGQAINKKTNESLIYSHVFDSFGLNQNTLFTNLDLAIDYAEIIKDISSDLIEKPILEEVDEFSSSDIMIREKEMFGFYFTIHPVSKYNKNTKIKINDVNKYLDKNIDLIVYVDYIKKIKTKNNEGMAFIIASDEESNIDLTLFPRVYETYSNVKKGNIIKVNGKVEKRFNKLQIIVNSIKILE